MPTTMQPAFDGWGLPGVGINRSDERSIPILLHRRPEHILDLVGMDREHD